jgi:GT2 family glycosyltransferase
VTLHDVHVVVLNWNGYGETEACVAGVMDVAPDVRIHIVDNGSEGDEAGRLARRFPDARIESVGFNAGFAGGVNRGIDAALAEGARFVFLLNNDARIDAGTLPALLDAARRRPDVGVFGPRIWRDRGAGVLWCCGVAFGFGPNLGRLRGFDRRGDGLFLEEDAPDSLTGCGLLVRREVFDRIGTLDEAYFVYLEDADFCLRAREAGFGLLYVPGASMEHPGGWSTGGGYSPGRKYLTAHGAVRFLKRHGTWSLWASWVVFDVVLWPLLFLSAGVRGRGRAAWAKARGTLDGLLGRPPKPPALKPRA